MEHKKNILIIIPKLVGGGAERVLINLLKQVDYQIYNIDLFIGLKGGRLEEEIPKEVNINFLFSFRIYEIITSVLVRHFSLTFPFKFFGKKISRDYDVGICFFESYYSNFLMNTRGELKKKTIFIHSSFKTYSNKFKKYKGESLKLIKERLNKIDIVVSVSQESLNEFKDLFGKHQDMRVIYNSMNVKEILSKAKDKTHFKLDKNKVNIIAVGSHIPVKGYEKLILACKSLKDQNVSFSLVILGEGKLFQYHQQLINKLDLSKHVFLLGFMKNPYPLIYSSDIYVMTSLAEGLPTALCEAIILNKPVITTNVPGCREVLDNGKYGFLVDNNVKSITEGLKLLILDKTRRSFFQDRSKSRSEIFDDKISLNKYYEIFNQ